MGYIVNGPGEMADADYGYVGKTPGVISLYWSRRDPQGARGGRRHGFDPVDQGGRALGGAGWSLV